MSRYTKEKVFLVFSKTLTLFSFSFLLFFIFIIWIKGIKAIDVDFLFTQSRNFGADGGIFYQITGSLLIISGAALLSFPIALGAAVCSSEYLARKIVKDMTGTIIYALNGVPSIIFGVFGLIFFVNFLKTGISWFVGSIVLACMILPTIMAAALQAMENIPDMYRESATALGLKKWNIITSVVIPQSFSGALSGLLLGLARAIGETAPIMFIATAFSGVLVPSSLFEPVTALPTHILALSENATNPEALTNAWGTAFVLVAIVFIFSSIAFLIRVNIKGISQK
ncbi:MAG: phosphate ABC transporter permease PstA [Nitrospinota bacterium]